MKSPTVLKPRRLALRSKAEEFRISPSSFASVAILRNEHVQPKSYYSDRELQEVPQRHPSRTLLMPLLAARPFIRSSIDHCLMEFMVALKRQTTIGIRVTSTCDRKPATVYSERHYAPTLKTERAMNRAAAGPISQSPGGQGPYPADMTAVAKASTSGGTSPLSAARSG